MSPSENAITIEDVVDSFSARLENGQHPSIEEYKSKYPHLADRIEAVLPALVVLENVDSDQGDRKLAVDDSIPEVLGDYQIIQEIGRGGMGIVFEAQHSTMRRRVALKVLPKSSAEKPNYLKRFLTEARSAGQLHHTNIVPVFEVGQSDGLHFYSMQYIHGDNLDHVIEDIRKLRKQSRDEGSLKTDLKKRHLKSQPHSQRSQSIALELVNGLSTTNGLQSNGAPATPLGLGDVEKRSLAESSRSHSQATTFAGHSTTTGQRNGNQYHNRVASVGVQIAEALDHAHEHGVLHRDIKPANLILDTEGNVWITDFGLAKLDANDLTQTGDIIGTLRYMAPERFAGDADSRSDIYSLGLTLYELATLRCAFGNDRGTLVQDVANSSSVINPRTIDETIPADLETIILKSIDPKPERRYQTAGEMAEDLELFLNDRPIRARRATLAEKFWRICRRNPVASSLSACLAMLLILTTAGSIQFARSELKNRKASQKQLFYSKLDQAKMRRFSGRPGQRTEAESAIRGAVALLPEMDFSDQEIQETQFLLRSELVAATSLPDIKRNWSHEFEPGWGERKRYTVSKNGLYFAEGHDEGRIRIRKVDDKSLVVELPGGRGKDPPWMMHFSPNSNYFIAKYHQPSVHDEFKTVVWDLRSGGKQVYQAKYVYEFDFADDDRLLSISYRDRVDIVRLKDAKVVKTIVPSFLPEGGCGEVQFSSDATAIAVSQVAEKRVEFWDLTNEPVLTDAVECDYNVISMDWDSSRQIFVAGCHHGVVNYWLGELSEAGGAVQLHQNTIFEIHLHPEHELVASSAWDNKTRFLDLVAAREVLSIEDHTLSHNGFCGPEQLALKGTSGQISIWRFELPLVQMFASSDSEGAGFRCCVHPIYHNIVVRSVGDSIEFWDIDARQRLYSLESDLPNQLKFSDSGDTFFVSSASGFYKWMVCCDGRALELTNQSALANGKVGGFDLFKTQNRALLAKGNKVQIIDSCTGALIQELGSHRNLSRVCLTANDQYALSGTWHGRGIKVWEVETGQHVQTVLEDIGSTSPIAHPTDPRRFFVSRHATSEFEIADSGIVEHPVSQSKKLKYEGSVLLTPDGQQILVQTNSYKMVLLNAETQRELVQIASASQSRIIDRCISPDGQTLILACFDNLQVIDLEKFRRKADGLGIGW